MRLLRFLCLLAAIAVVYFAQYIFDYGSLTEFFPEWFLARFSFASRLMRWQPEDLRVLAWGGSALAAIIFGLIAPAWPSVQGLSYVTPVIRKGRQPNSLFAIVALVLLCCLLACCSTVHAHYRCVRSVHPARNAAGCSCS